MAETRLATASERQIWRKKYFRDYVRKSRFLPYMGNENTDIIITYRDLEAQNGKTVHIPWVGRLRAPGVYNNGVLEGNEEDLPNADYPITVQWIRNGVRVAKSTSYKTEIPLMDAARPALRDWSSTNLQTWIILNGLFSVTVATGSGVDQTSVNYPLVAIYDNEGSTIRPAATAGQANSWIQQNSDRVLFGALIANNTGTFSTSLANIDATDDRMSTVIGSLAKQLAVETEGTGVTITPHVIEDGDEWFVCFLGSRAMRDLRRDSAMIQANRDARPRDVKTNPIFQGGDLVYDGVIYRAESKITALLTKAAPQLIAGGAAGIPVEPFALCGAGAVGVGWASTPDFKTDRTMDYEFRPGVAIQENRGVEKLAYVGKQLGIVTGFVAGTAQ